MTRQDKRRLVEAMECLGVAATRAAFAVLDLVLAIMPLEDRPPTSWEVEREQFMRALDRRE